MAKTDNLTDFLTDLADAIREKKGTTELINPQDFSTEIRGISGGGNLDEEKFGFVFLTKEVAVTGMAGGNIPESVLQDQLKNVMDTFITLGLVATKKNGWDIDPISELSDNIAEGRFTYENWDAIALNLDAVVFNDKDYDNPWIPIWKTIAPTIDEARQGLAQVFPTQMTEEEFFKDTTN